LLFRPSTPSIDSVTQADLTREEYRIASGAIIAAKLKVRGTGFNPLLRVLIGEQPALAFVFENPNSADVMVGDMPPGTYDLVLYDGVQEVARANGAVTLKQTSGQQVRAVGRLLNLTEAEANTLKPGFKTPHALRAGFEIVAVGPPVAAHSHVKFGEAGIDVVVPGSTERPVVIVLQCDAGGPDCSVGGTSLDRPPPVAVVLDGGVNLAIDEVLPTSSPSVARVQIRFTGPQTALMKVGDREPLLDQRAAVISAIGGRDGNSINATLELGADSSREGWSYRGRSIRPGARFRFVTSHYESDGIVGAIVVDSPAPAKTP
jgi:hypothetical protein